MKALVFLMLLLVALAACGSSSSSQGEKAKYFRIHHGPDGRTFYARASDIGPPNEHGDIRFEDMVTKRRIVVRRSDCTFTPVSRRTVRRRQAERFVYGEAR